LKTTSRQALQRRKAAASNATCARSSFSFTLDAANFLLTLSQTSFFAALGEQWIDLTARRENLGRKRRRNERPNQSEDKRPPEGQADRRRLSALCCQRIEDAFPPPAAALLKEGATEKKTRLQRDGKKATTRTKRWVPRDSFCLLHVCPSTADCARKRKERGRRKETNDEEE